MGLHHLTLPQRPEDVVTHDVLMHEDVPPIEGMGLLAVDEAIPAEIQSNTKEEYSECQMGALFGPCIVH